MRDSEPRWAVDRVASQNARAVAKLLGIDSSITVDRVHPTAPRPLRVSGGTVPELNWPRDLFSLHEVLD